MWRYNSAVNNEIFITISKETVPTEEKYPISDTVIEIKAEYKGDTENQPPPLERATEIELEATPVINEQNVMDDKTHQQSEQKLNNVVEISVPHNEPNLGIQKCMSFSRSLGYYALRIGGTVGTFATTMSGLYNMQEFFAKYADMQGKEFSISAWSFNITASVVMAGLAWKGIKNGIYRYSQWETEMNIMGKDVKAALSLSIIANKENKKLKKILDEKDEQLSLLQTTVAQLNQRVNQLSKSTFLNPEGTVPVGKKRKKLRRKKADRHLVTDRFFKAGIDIEKSPHSSPRSSSIGSDGSVSTPLTKLTTKI